MNDELQKALAFIKEQYFNDDVCMGDFLDAIQISEIETAIGTKLSLEDAFMLYVEAKKWADGDEFIQIKDDESVEL